MDDVVFMVKAKSRAACQAQLDRLCALLDAEVVTLPTDAIGRDWIARAVPATKAPTADGGRGPVVSG